LNLPVCCDDVLCSTIQQGASAKTHANAMVLMVKLKAWGVLDMPMDLFGQELSWWPLACLFILAGVKYFGMWSQLLSHELRPEVWTSGAFELWARASVDFT
jgi:hypothetical protein